MAARLRAAGGRRSAMWPTRAAVRSNEGLGAPRGLVTTRLNEALSCNSWICLDKLDVWVAVTGSVCSVSSERKAVAGAFFGRDPGVPATIEVLIRDDLSRLRVAQRFAPREGPDLVCLTIAVQVAFQTCHPTKETRCGGGASQ